MKMTSFLPKWLNRASTFLDSTSGAGRFVFTIAAQSSAAVEISVLAEQQVLSAPYQINADAIVTNFGIDAPATNAEYDPQFHDIEYIWSIEKVGDASYATSTYSAVPDLPTHMKVKGTKYGKRICHVIGIGDVVAGETNTFRFTVTAINLATGDSVTSAPVDKVVAHPNDFFSAAETFVVRTTSATDYPTTTNPIYSSIEAAKNAIELTSLTRARICAERGQVATNFGRGPSNSSGTAILYDAWGSGGDYVNAVAGVQGFAFMREIGDNYISYQISGYEIGGGGDRAFNLAYSALGADNALATIADCKMGECAQIAEGSGVRGWLAYSNMEGIQYYNVGMFSAGTKAISLIGTKMGQSPDANSHNAMSFILNGADPDFAGGGYGLRMGATTADLVYISQCDFHQRQGWFENAPGYADVQNWLRLNMTDTQRVVIDRVVSETGFGAAAHENNDDGDVDTPNDRPYYGNILVDKCLFIGQSDTKYFVGFDAPMTVRNCIFIKPPSKNVRHGFERYIGGTPPVDSLHKIYNNSFINLDYAATAASIHGSSTRVVLANNVNHQPNLDTPISAGTFSLTELFTPRYIGYYTAVDGQDPHYQVDVATITTPFTVGETVTGGTSGVVKTYAGSQLRFQSGTQLLFDMSVVFDRLDQAAGFERFTAGETLSGSLGGAATLSLLAANSNPFDTTSFGIGLIARTKTATHKLAYDGQTANFTEGETLTGGTSGATATICQVYDDGATGVIYLQGITGTFVDNETITDGGGGSATANGTVQSAGTGALWVPTSAIALESGTWAEKPFVRKGFTGQDITASQGAGLIDA